jgi:hypothetical protein
LKVNEVPFICTEPALLTVPLPVAVPSLTLIWPPLWIETVPLVTSSDEPLSKVRLPPLATTKLPPLTRRVAPLAMVPLPARVSYPPLWTSMTQPLQARFKPTIGLGMTLLTTMVVGEALVSWALSPVLQPGKPPGGVQRAPLVVVQFAVGGAALEVTLYAVLGLHTMEIVAAPMAVATISVKSAEAKKIGRRRRDIPGPPATVFI